MTVGCSVCSTHLPVRSHEVNQATSERTMEN
jgi:hypothetical protein